ncbi:hypothetical protein TrVFT333_004134 [Trichoderma virens FT-333]|nr:hypothetical protein TrVFT333_004134 [Trichoderma virens FT-333]
MKNLAPEELELKKRSKKKGSSRQVIIHEFEKTTKFPGFLKTAAATDRKTATEYVEGKGWVDEEGNIVEEVKEKEKEKAKLPQRPKKAPQPRKVSEEPEDDDSTSSSGTSSDGTSSEEESEEESEAESEEEVEAEVEKEAAEVPVQAATKPEDEEEKDDDSDSSSDDTSDSGTSSEEEEDESPKAAEQTTPITSKPNASKSTPASAKSLAIKIPPPETPSNGNVHPLEALYKRPKSDSENPTSVPKEEPFSFFGGGEDEEDESEATPANVVPMTPFTRQDYEWRNIRSAAPTPDTAHPSRMSRFWGASPEKDVEMEDDVANALREEEQEMEEGEDEDDGGPGQGKQSATTDFQKWFWENRRDLNRSWMTRRKTAAKEKRHRENKARASKAL